MSLTDITIVPPASAISLQRAALMKSRHCSSVQAARFFDKFVNAVSFCSVITSPSLHRQEQKSRRKKPRSLERPRLSSSCVRLLCASFSTCARDVCSLLRGQLLRSCCTACSSGCASLLRKLLSELSFFAVQTRHRSAADRTL